jgi:hypothetical protein
MKTAILITMYSVLSGAGVVLGAPAASAPGPDAPGTSPAPDIPSLLELRQGEWNPNRCPGGRDFAFCVPYMNVFNCPPITGPGGFPQPDGACVAMNNQICACWCTCNRAQCDAANLRVPDYC